MLLAICLIIPVLVYCTPQKVQKEIDFVVNQGDTLKVPLC